MNMKKYGLIGKNISYSLSKEIFDNKCFKDSEYFLYSISEEEITKEFLNQFNGLNVTIPYKNMVGQFLDEIRIPKIDGVEFNAVNCISNEDGKLIGYNTDVYGIEKTLNQFIKSDKKVLICGNGGASEALQYYFTGNNIKYIVVTRSEYTPISGFGFNISYDELFECDSEFFKNINIVVNATPVGTINYPGKVNIPYEKFENIDIAFDLVYNPCETEFLKTFKELGKQIINGYIMLQNQALKSYKIWKLLKNKSI